MEKKDFIVEVAKGVSKKGNEYHRAVISVEVNGVKIEVGSCFLSDQSLGLLALAGIKVGA